MKRLLCFLLGHRMQARTLSMEWVWDKKAMSTAGDLGAARFLKKPRQIHWTECERCGMQP